MEMLFLIIALLFFASGAWFNSIMDTIVHHWETSIFFVIKNSAFKKWMQSDWRLKYIDGDWRNGIVRILDFYFPGYEFLFKVPFTNKYVFVSLLPEINFEGIKKPAFMWDGWHCAKVCMLISNVMAALALFVAGGFAHMHGNFSFWPFMLQSGVYMVVFLTVWYLAFASFYKIIWIQPNYRRFEWKDIFLPYF